VIRVLCVLALVAAGQQPSGPLPRQPAAAPAAPARAPAAAPTPARPPAPPGLSWEDADQVSQTLARIERRLRTGRPAAEQALVVTERQLNSYLNLALATALPPGISGLELRISQDRLGAHALVDLDRVKGKLPPGATGGLLALLGGTLPVELSGRLAATNGTGRIDVDQASVGGVSLPASLVAQIVSLSTRSAKQPRGFDIAAPFALPWTAREVRLEPGRALVSFFPKQP
jgi:hypothetical protein